MHVVRTKIFQEPVLVEACPGAGKTRFGLEVIHELLSSGEISRAIIVVPTLGIADGWLHEASAASLSSPTIPLRGPRDWHAVQPIGDGYAGVIVTYQSLFAMTDMFLAHATDPGHRTLVVFDEVHHAGASAAWGVAAQQAFAGTARAVLSLTGTPFRTARDAIVFVPSVGGSALPHYSYSYAKAIEDDACRPVQFVEARGETTFRTEDDRVHTVTFDDVELTDVGMRRRLRTALEWVAPTSIADTMIRHANEYLLRLRRAGDRDAAGLVVCVDCSHADRIATHMADHVVGARPTVACSRLNDVNDPNPANAIKRFKHSHDPWIVAVNMISEGIDIRRLRCVVYLTNRLTLLAFRQIVGRVVRTDASNIDDHGRVYIPADPRLLEMAHQITDEVRLLPPPITIVMDAASVALVHVEADDSEQRVPFEALGSTGQTGSVFDSAGRIADPQLLACARLFVQREGLTGTDPESLALLAYENEGLRAKLLELRGLL